MQTPTTPKRSKILYLVGIFLFIFGAIFGLVGQSIITSEHRYEGDGATVEGRVTGKRAETRRDNNKNNTTSTSYYVSYRFTPEQGTEIEGSNTVSSEVFQHISQGDPIAIQYIKGEPTTNRVATESSYVVGYIFSIIGLLITLAGVGAIYYEIKQRRLISRLERDGMMVEATISDVGPGSLTVNNVQQWHASYIFRDLKGIEVTGQTPHMAPEQAQHYKPGEKGRVKFDRDNSSLNIWVGR